MLTPGIAQFHHIRREATTSGRGISVGRGTAASAYKPPFEDEHARHQQRLEDIRLVGYRYLKPPGVTRTLRAIHEDEAYAAEASANMSLSSDALRAEASMPSAADRSEDESMAEDDEVGDDAPDFSLPALNASFPSMYYH